MLMLSATPKTEAFLASEEARNAEKRRTGMEISQRSIKNSVATAKPIFKFELCETKPPFLKPFNMFAIGSG